MLWFIGLGISGISELSENTRNIIKNAESVYLESFTSPISADEKEQLENICKGDFKIAKRWMVEDGNEILDNAKNKETVCGVLPCIRSALSRVWNQATRERRFGDSDSAISCQSAS